jgi:hypothetical protein
MCWVENFWKIAACRRGDRSTKLSYTPLLPVMLVTVHHFAACGNFARGIAHLAVETFLSDSPAS